MKAFSQARFLLSAAQPPQFPADQGLEVAFAGRSNAGKSSAINALCGRRGLARASKTPGRTRLLNFFELSPGARVVDLPGYGYAAASAGERRSWVPLIEALAQRRSLVALFLIVDARRGLLDGDRELLRWAGASRLAIEVLLAKSDTLKSAELRAVQSRSLQELGPDIPVQLFSAHDGTGVESARLRLAKHLKITPAAQIGGRAAGAHEPAAS